MWAEAMEIYRSGKCQLRLPKEMEKELCEYQKQFMQEDTKKELILDYLEHYEEAWYVQGSYILRHWEMTEIRHNGKFVRLMTL